MNFLDLCSFFEEIKITKGPREKYTLIQNRFKTMREGLCHNPGVFFNVLRLILPDLDRERESYKMKEAKVARTLIKMLDLPPGNDRNVLNKSYLVAAQTTDFGEVVYSVIRKYLSNTKTSLTVLEVNQSLDLLTKRKNESEAETIMMNLFKKVSPEDIRWIIRIILKNLKLGISSNQILNCYHKDGASFYASNSNLRKVCHILANQNVRLHELDIELFEAFRPMLSKRIDGVNFKKELPDNKLFYVENKFDGERFQLHLRDNEFKYFSRNGFDFTENLGKSYETGIFTPHLKGLFDKNIKNAILDGELMVWNKKTKQFGSKGMALDVKKLRQDNLHQPCFVVYDIILLNNRVLTNVPFRERIEILKTVFCNVKIGTIVLSKVKQVHSRQEIIDELNQAVDNEEEGIILKDPDSVYKYSDRNSGWFKLKLEYFQDVMNDMDLILMGAARSPYASDSLRSFFVGIRSGNASNGKPLYLCIGKVTTGLNMEEVENLAKKIKLQGKKFENFNSENLKFGKETPDYYIDPENSLVFEVRATELIRNTDNAYKTGYTLRFPRILKIREDKPVDECMSINELLELTKNNKSVIKLNKRNIELEEILKTKTKKVKQKDIVMPTIHDSKKVSDILDGYNIFVMNGSPEMDKEKAESIIKKAGGTVSYRVKENVDIVLAGDRSEEIRQLIQKRPKYDIINLAWLNRVKEDGNILGYDQKEVYYIGYNYKNCLSDELDKYGDSFTLETDDDKLKKTFQTISDMGEFSSLGTTVRLHRRKYFNEYFAYFDKFSIPDDQNSEIIYDCFIDQLEFQYYGGNVCEKIYENVNLIVYNGQSDRKIFLENYIKSLNNTRIGIKTKTFIYE
ncbi:DNA ligase 4 isoform X1 [Leptinotarsa decemlineata]|uniref:DNA ligase 4 isoform X1 n=1 Tax=Leptinotarsa decemlineata TaxID=7539 RepID=UPI003D307CE2